MKPPKPGMYYNVPFEEYASWEAVNNSSLPEALRSPSHYRNPPPRRDSPAFKFGRYVHDSILEPVDAVDRWAVRPDLTEGIQVDGRPAKNPKATKEYKERVATWNKQNADKDIVSQEDCKLMEGMRAELLREPRTRNWLCNDGHAEVSMVWRDECTGVLCRGRIDKVMTEGNLLIDLKTIADASAYQSSMMSFGYYRQAAFYTDGWRALTGEDRQFGFAFVEKERPFGVISAVCNRGVLHTGRYGKWIEKHNGHRVQVAQGYKEALEAVAWCKANPEKVRGYEQPDELTLPVWAMPDQVLTCGSESLEVK